MGQTTSSDRPCQHSSLTTTSAIGIEKLVKERGGISIQGRYTNKRFLKSDFAFEMEGRKPKIIGTGMSGSVRLATGRADGRRYAVKSLNKRSLSTRMQSELRGEVEIYLTLDHPHIARLEQVYETEEHIHLVMEHLSGGELYDCVIKTKMYTEEAAIDTVHQMLLAVNYLHAHKICHRDLKLENFMYESPDHAQVKLIDFGFARKCIGSARMSQACGSVHYVAPEVLAESYTEKADMWSLGVVSHMILTGSPVFRGSDDEIISKIRRGEKQLSSRFCKISAVAQDFVSSLLVMDPAKRLSAQDALQHPFLASKISKQKLDANIVDDLRKFSRAPPLRRACLSMMAWSLTQEDRNKLMSKFLDFDMAKTGSISQGQFRTLLQESSKISSSEADFLFSTLDSDHDGTVCYSEFLAAVIQDRTAMRDDIVKKSFARFDQDCSGTITAEDLRTVMGDTFEDVDIKELITEADMDGSGLLNYIELLRYMQNLEGRRILESQSTPSSLKPSQGKMEVAASPSSLMRAAAQAARV